MARALQLEVHCNRDHRGEPIPERFRIGTRWFGVSEIIDRWFGPDHRYFKLRGDDEGVYILRHDGPTDSWSLTLFDSGTQQAPSRLSST